MVFQNRKNKVPTLITHSEPPLRHSRKHFCWGPMKRQGVNFSRLTPPISESKKIDCSIQVLTNIGSHSLHQPEKFKMPQTLLIALLFSFVANDLFANEFVSRKTHLTIVDDQFWINDKPTYAGQVWNGKRIEGLLMNSRMVQSTFDDLNPETRQQWAYPDTHVWDAARNTQEFLSAMPAWRQHGLLAITVNLQGGSPQGYSKQQPWHNSSFTESGALRPEYMDRLAKVIDRADELGMVVIVGYFYFGQDQRLENETAVIAATEAATQWLLDKAYTNVIVEVNNECNVKAYDHAILKEDRIHSLISRVRDLKKEGRRLLVGTSYGGGTVPMTNVLTVSDFLLIHGNGVSDPNRIRDMVKETRLVPGYRKMPILFNEDDHFLFDKPDNNFIAAIDEYASWGYFDFRMKDETFVEGYQSVPVDWTISSDRKRGFFHLLQKITTGR